MKSRICQLGVTVLAVILTALFVSGCGTYGVLGPQEQSGIEPMIIEEATAVEEPIVDDGNLAVKVVIKDTPNQDLYSRMLVKSDPQEIVSHARNLSQKGRHGDAAAVFMDAAERFESVGSKFEINCKKEACREYYYDGNFSKAGELLNQIDTYQDVYSRTTESESFRRLRELIIEKNTQKPEVVKK